MAKPKPKTQPIQAKTCLFEKNGHCSLKIKATTPTTYSKVNLCECEWYKKRNMIMTREEAYNWNENSHDLRFTGEVEDMQESIHFLITKIYDHHEAQVKKLNKEIERLKREGTR